MGCGSSGTREDSKSSKKNSSWVGRAVRSVYERELTPQPAHHKKGLAKRNSASLKHDVHKFAREEKLKNKRQQLADEAVKAFQADMALQHNLHYTPMQGDLSTTGLEAFAPRRLSPWAGTAGESQAKGAFLASTFQGDNRFLGDHNEMFGRPQNLGDPYYSLTTSYPQIPGPAPLMPVATKSLPAINPYQQAVPFYNRSHNTLPSWGTDRYEKRFGDRGQSPINYTQGFGNESDSSSGRIHNLLVSSILNSDPTTDSDRSNSKWGGINEDETVIVVKSNRYSPSLKDAAFTDKNVWKREYSETSSYRYIDATEQDTNPFGVVLTDTDDDKENIDDQDPFGVNIVLFDDQYDRKI